jgi:hypothetical protein
MERNKNADSAFKKATQKDKMYFQDKLRESGQALDESRSRCEQLTREAETALKYCAESANVLSVGWTLEYLEMLYDHHTAIHGWLHAIMTSETLKNWKSFVESQKVQIEQNKAAGIGYAKKVFGNTLEGTQLFDLERNENAEAVPGPILRMICHINDHCLEVEGLFRLSGNQNEIDTLRRRIDTGESVEFTPSTDPHIVAALLKKYLRDMPEPIIPFDFYEGMSLISLI